ncbi:hypothetical protein RKLH11_4222 [Rhodobacteraceae bacterium KLH11]|nr:hypothetical protein RKLH11_4222 [Rhodobacteraceae bacterium KLH11]
MDDQLRFSPISAPCDVVTTGSGSDVKPWQFPLIKDDGVEATPPITDAGSRPVASGATPAADAALNIRIYDNQLPAWRTWWCLCLVGFVPVGSAHHRSISE